MVKGSLYQVRRSTINEENALNYLGWTVRNHICQDNGATGLDANCNSDIFTSAGIFTTPARGVYHCCASFRCKQGGYCDFTVNRIGNGAGASAGLVSQIDMLL